MTRALGAFLATLAFTAGARAEQVTLFASRDTTIYEHDGSLSNGKGQHLFAGLNGRRSPRRALIAFDVARALPAGAKVTAAALSVRVSRTQDRKTRLTLHQLLADWGEGSSRASGQEGGGAPAAPGDATWTHRSWPSLLWDEPGGDFEAGDSATLELQGVGSYLSTGDALAADVQVFLDYPERNFGWILDDATGAGVAKRFDSHDNLSSSGPQLSVTFEPPAAETGACCLPDGSCGVALDPGSECAGSYLGSATTCAPGACPEPTGACCGNDVLASCEVRKLSECGADGWQGRTTSCSPNPCQVVLTPFVDELPRPAVATPVDEDDDGAHYRIRMFQTTQQLHRDLPPTTVWGFHDGTIGGYPGPTIEARTGTPVYVNWSNDLRDGEGELLTEHALEVDHCLHGAHEGAPRTVVHLHGGRVPADFDGQPELTLLPGEATEYVYPNQQRAATIWYHDHALGITRLNVYMGLAGFYIIRDEAEAELGLPSGEYEIPLAIQDRSFNPDGSLSYPARWQEAFFGNTPVVNGKASPYLEVDRGAYRFRLLNGSTSRTYTLSLSTGQAIVQIGNDGGLLRQSFARRSLTLAPGERADVIIDFEYGADEVILQNTAMTPYPNGGDDAQISQIMKFVRSQRRGHTAPIPVELVPPEKLDEADAVMTRDFVLAQSEQEECGGRMWTINGKGWGDITEQPHLGTSEVWRFINRTGVTHPMHMHALFFQVLDRQPFTVVGDELQLMGEPQRPDRPDEGWKDTVKVAPFEIVRVLAPFDDYEGRFAYHCHLLEHEDHGMMRQFEAIAVCGDHALARGIEDCDDGNTHDGDGCDAKCSFEGDGAGGAAEPNGDQHGSAVSTDDGCGCRAASGRGQSSPTSLLGAALAAVLALMRRRPDRSHPQDRKARGFQVGNPNPKILPALPPSCSLGSPGSAADDAAVVLGDDD